MKSLSLFIHYEVSESKVSSMQGNITVCKSNDTDSFEIQLTVVLSGPVKVSLGNGCPTPQKIFCDLIFN